MAYDNEHLIRMRNLIEQQKKISRNLSESNLDKLEEMKRTLNLSDDEILSRDSYQPPQPSRPIDVDLKLNVLIEENKKLKEQHRNLIDRTYSLIDAYHKLDAENKKMRIEIGKKRSKEKRKEFWKKILTDLKDSINKIIKKIIVWFNT